MSKQLSEKWAKRHIMTIGMFYVFSGIWLYLIGGSGETGVSFGDSVLSEIYSTYAVIIGPITVLTGILLMVELKLSRLVAIALAWWNLFIGPFVLIFWNMYTISTGKLSSSTSLWVTVAIIILIMTAIRLFIIYMLRPSKAGYLFLKEK